MLIFNLNNIKSNGSVLLGYLWNTNFNSSNYSDDWKDIYKLSITKEELKEFITEYHQINGARDYLWDENEKRDLVLVYRKK